MIGLTAMMLNHNKHTLNDNLLKYRWTEQLDVVYRKL